MQMLQHLRIALDKGIRAIVVTRPVEAFKAKDRNALQRVLEVLEHNDISVVFKSNIHQKFAIMDQKTVWYGRQVWIEDIRQDNQTDCFLGYFLIMGY
jgi:hypothetical protein